MSDELTGEEEAAIRSLKRLASRWPQSLKLISMDGNLHVIHAADERYAAQRASAADRQDCLLADIYGIPNDGGAW